MTIVHFSTCRETNKTKNHSKNKHKVKQMIRLYKKEQSRGLTNLPWFSIKAVITYHIFDSFKTSLFKSAFLGLSHQPEIPDSCKLG